MITRRLLRFAFVFLALLAPLRSQGAEKTGTITGRVVDQDGKPVPKVELKLHEWDGKYNPVPQVIESGEDGRFMFANVKHGHPMILSRDPRFAITCQSFSFEEEEAKAVEVRVGPGVQSSLLITDPEGNPLPGARLREFGIDPPGNAKAYFRGLDFKACNFPQPSSDEQGIIQLPPLIAGTLVQVIVEHDDWAATQVKDIKVQRGQIAKIALQEGIKVRFDVTASPEFKGNLEELDLTIDLRSEPFALERSLINVPVAIHENSFSVCVLPGMHQSMMFKCEGAIVTPQLMRKGFQIGSDATDSFSLLVRPAIDVHGKVVEAGTGKGLSGQQILVETINLAPDEIIVPDGTQQYAYLAWAETDDQGEYVAKLPSGKSRVSLETTGRVPEQDYYEIDVIANKENRFPDIVAGEPPVILGRVVDRAGQPLAGAVVRFGSQSLRYVQPIRTDEAGHFELKAPTIPLDWETSERRYDQKVYAFLPHDPRAGIVDIDLKSAGSSLDVTITLEEHEPNWLLQTLSTEMTDWEHGNPPESSKVKLNPEMQPGKVPPELDCREWLNSPDGKQSLADYRGKYVFLDFWTTWCGPCRADEPSIKMLHELYGDRLAVIGVHDNSVPVDEIRQFVQEHKILWPVAIDHEDGRTLRAYEQVGVSGYPAYILLDPEGKVITCDRTIPGPSLRIYKLERVRQLLLETGDATP